MALPQLLQRGYSRPCRPARWRLVGTLGILIPPSIAMIVYGTFTETSVSQLFMAGVVPRPVLTALSWPTCSCMPCCGPRSRRRERGPQNLGEFVSALADLLPFAIVIGGTMGSLYFGWGDAHRGRPPSAASRPSSSR